MPASKPIPREADGTVDIKQARKRMRGHRTDAEIEEKAKREVRAKEPKRIQVPKYLPQGMAAERAELGEPRDHAGRRQGGGQLDQDGERLLRPVPELRGGAWAERVGTLPSGNARAAQG
mgnify:CR=1 FL=1